MSNRYCILLLLLGFFLTPALSYACDSDMDDTEMSCCAADQTFGQAPSGKVSASCCSGEASGQETCGGNCEGACGQSACSCPITHSNFALLVLSFDWEGNRCRYAFQKTKFHDKEFYLSSGFNTVWLPPKIG